MNTQKLRIYVYPLLQYHAHTHAEIMLSMACNSVYIQLNPSIKLVQGRVNLYFFGSKFPPYQVGIKRVISTVRINSALRKITFSYFKQ